MAINLFNIGGNIKSIQFVRVSYITPVGGTAYYSLTINPVNPAKTIIHGTISNYSNGYNIGNTPYYLSNNTTLIISDNTNSVNYNDETITFKGSLYIVEYE